MGVYRYCGRDFTADEMETIRAIVARDSGNSRTAISRLVCEALQWYKPDGGLKDMSCRVAMLRMCESGLISLPPSRGLNGNPKMEIRFTEETAEKPCLTTPAGHLTDLSFDLVSGKKAILPVERIHSSISLFRLQEACRRPVAIHGPKRQRHAGPAGLRRGRLENGSEGPIYGLTEYLPMFLSKHHDFRTLTAINTCLIRTLRRISRKEIVIFTSIRWPKRTP